MGDYTYFGTEIYDQTSKIVNDISDQLNLDNKEDMENKYKEDMNEEYQGANVYPTNGCVCPYMVYYDQIYPCIVCDDQPILIKSDESSETKNSTEQIKGLKSYSELQKLFNAFNKLVVVGYRRRTEKEKKCDIIMNNVCQKICEKIYKLLSKTSEKFYLIGFREITDSEYPREILNLEDPPYKCLLILPPFKIFNRADMTNICNNTELLLLKTDDKIKQEYNNLVWMDKYRWGTEVNANQNVYKKYILPINKINHGEKTKYGNAGYGETGYGILKKIYEKMNLIDPTMYRLCIERCLTERLY